MKHSKKWTASDVKSDAVFPNLYRMYMGVLVMVIRESYVAAPPND